MTQLDIFTPPSTLDKTFWAFHALNPQVFEELEKMTQQAYTAGTKKVGIGMMFEVLRWNRMFATTTDDYKLNNSHRSRYARILVDSHPEWKDMFSTRRIHS